MSAMVADFVTVFLITVMAGIMVMDELVELQKRVKGLESEMESLRRTRDEALQRADSVDDLLKERLSSVTDKIEAVATKLA
mgnify:CR=1 FL=1